MDLEFSSLLDSSINSKITTMLLQRMYENSAKPSLAVPDSTQRPMASRMRVENRVAVQGAQNMKDAASMVTVAQSDVTAVKNALVEMKKLASEMATRDNLSPSDYASAQERLQKNAQELVDIAKNSNFNSLSLMDGRAGMNKDGVIQLQAGNSRRDQALTNFLNSDVGAGQVVSGGDINLNNLSGMMTVTDQTTAKTTMGIIDQALNYVTNVEAQYSYDIKSLNNMSTLLLGQADIYEEAMKNHQIPQKQEDTATQQPSLGDLLGGNVMNMLG